MKLWKIRHLVGILNHLRVELSGERVAPALQRHHLCRMLSQSSSQALTPATIVAKIKTAHRVISGLTSSADRNTVQQYIEEMEQELARLVMRGFRLT